MFGHVYVCLSLKKGGHTLQTNCEFLRFTLPETNSSPLKTDGWNTILSNWGPAYFQVRTVVSGRVHPDSRNRHLVVREAKEMEETLWPSNTVLREIPIV